MHMSYEDFGNFTHSQVTTVTVRIWLHRKLTYGSLSAVKHYYKENREIHSKNKVVSKLHLLHSEPFPRPSRTRLEQFLVSEGPPPLVVPRKDTVISRILNALLLRPEQGICV